MERYDIINEIIKDDKRFILIMPTIHVPVKFFNRLTNRTFKNEELD